MDNAQKLGVWIQGKEKHSYMTMMMMMMTKANKEMHFQIF